MNEFITVGDKLKIVWKGKIADSEIVAVPTTIRSHSLWGVVVALLSGTYSKTMKIRLPDGSVIDCKVLVPTL